MLEIKGKVLKELIRVDESGVKHFTETEYLSVEDIYETLEQLKVREEEKIQFEEEETARRKKSLDFDKEKLTSITNLLKPKK